MDINLRKIHDDLVTIAFEAGAMITAANPNSVSIGTKLNCKATHAPPPTAQATPPRTRKYNALY
jgi:hypothetical protein